MQLTKDLENKYCDIHPQQHIAFVCFDPQCSQSTAQGCQLCLRASHGKCSDSYILATGELETKLIFKQFEVEPSIVLDAILESLDKQLYDLENKLEQRHKDFIADYLKEDLPSIFTLDNLPEKKLSLNLSINPKTDMIEVRSKLENTPLDNRRITNYLKHDVSRIYKSFCSKLGKQGFKWLAEFHAIDWVCHPLIEVSELGQELKFKRIPDNKSCKYYCAVYNKPLLTNSCFKVTLDTIETTDRYLEIGIISKAKLATIKGNGYTKSFGEGLISFCGYSYTGGLSGTIPTTSSKSLNGYKAGDSIYLEFYPGKSLRIFNDQMTTNLSCCKPELAGEYYFFLVLYHPTTSIRVEKTE